VSQRFIIDPKNPEVDRVRSNAMRAVEQAGSKRAEVLEIKQHRSKRTNLQNRTLWGVVYPPLMDHMGLRGDREKEELHEYFCGEYFGWKSYEIMGQAKSRPVRTTTTDEDGKKSELTTVEFQDFCEFIRQRASEVGLVIPDPIPNYIRELEAAGRVSA
jgi:hypothetical protein